VSTMVGQLYRPGDSRRDAGFTIFYMGINLGALIAPLICGWFAQSAPFQGVLAHAGIDGRRSWSWGCGAAGVGMLVGLALYLWLRDRYLPGIGMAGGGAVAQPGRAPAKTGPPGRLTRDEWQRVAALLIMFFFVAFFWLVYEQAGSSLNLFADRYTDLRVGNTAIPSSWFQSVQPLFVVLLAPVFAYLWRRMRDAGREPATPLKIVLGLALIGVGWAFLIMAGRTVDACLSAHASTECAVASPAWLTMFYLFSVLGELCVSPVGLSYVTKIAPARYVAFLMGAWFLTNASGNKLAGFLASLTARVPSQTAFFTIPLVISLTAAVLLVLFVPWLRRLTRSVTVLGQQSAVSGQSSVVSRRSSATARATTRRADCRPPQLALYVVPDD
jgi:POT family proton-dependent oligopeptide transporter